MFLVEEMRTRVTQRIAGCTGIFSTLVFFLWRQLRQEEYHSFSSYDVQLALGFNIPLLLCFLLCTYGHR